MIINDNTEIASLLRGPFRSISIKVGPCFSRACQRYGNDLRTDKTYATFRSFGSTSYAKYGFNILEIYTCNIESAEPIFIPNTRIMSLQELLDYMANALTDLNRLSSLITRECMGTNDTNYEAACRAFKSYWEYCNVKMSLPAMFINTLAHNRDILLFIDDKCEFAVPSHNILFDQSYQVFTAELRPSIRERYL